jgi:ribose-phosphate pyrophosphokinase
MNKLLFATPPYQDFGQQIATLLNANIGKVEERTFPDGERYQRVIDDVDGKDIILVGGSISDLETLRIYDLACALVKYGAHRLDIVMPYYGYSTMERAVYAGDVVTAKTRARLFSSIPRAVCGNHVFLIDLHSEGIPHYFEGDITTTHLSAKSILTQTIKNVAEKDFVIGSTDAGRAKSVEALANTMGVSAALILKRRINDRDTEVIGVNANVKDKQVVIYDDMIRTGSSLIHAAQAYQQAGAKNLIAVCSHGVFPENAYDRLIQTGLFTQILATDSHPTAVQLSQRPEKPLTLIPIAPIFAQSLRKNLQ